MTDVNDFRTGILQNSSHDVDGGIVTVKKGGGGDHLNGMFRGIGFGFHARCFSFSDLGEFDQSKQSLCGTI
jgi:hypothetical protein